jgi:hypothetical protein
VQLRSASPDSTTFAAFVAFYDSAASALAVTMVTGNTPQSIALQGANLPASFQKWVTNATTLCVNQGNVANGATVDIPANSVVTLYGTGYALPTTGARMPEGRSFTQLRQAVSEQRYDVAGRKILSTSSTCCNHLTLIVRNRQSRMEVQGPGR